MKKNFIFIFILLALFILLPSSIFASDLTIMPIYSESWGDSALLESGNEYLLVDVTFAQSTHVIDFLKNKGIKKFSLYLSHYHGDHYGNFNTLKIDDKNVNLFEYLIRNSNKGGYNYTYSIENVYLPDSIHLNKTEFANYKLIADSIKLAATESNVNVVELKQGSKFEFGNTSAEVLYFNTEITNLNNASLVTMFTNGSTRYLSAGDIEKTTEQILINSNIDISADIFKLNHHGIQYLGNISNVKEFVNKVRPKYSYFHNIENVEGSAYTYEALGQSLINLNNISSNIYDVNINGNIRFEIENDEITPIVEKNKHTITINYIDEDTSEILKTKQFDFNYEIFKTPITYYLYDYEESFENYTMISDLSEIPQSGVLTEDKIYNLKYKKTKNEVIENPSTGKVMKYGILIIIVLISFVLYVLIRKKTKFPKHN